MTRGVTHQNPSEDTMMLALITTAHHTCYPNPIVFRAGERVRIGHEDDEFPGWVRTFTADGNEGWAPLSLLTPISAEEALARQTIPPASWMWRRGSGYGWSGSWQAGSGCITIKGNRAGSRPAPSRPSLEVVDGGG